MPTPQEIQQERRENARRAVRAYLAERSALAFHPRTILNRVNEGHANDFTEEEINAALAFLVGDGQAEKSHEKLGATLYFKITSKGVIEHERDGL